MLEDHFLFANYQKFVTLGEQYVHYGC
jgi:hypothetical protein